MKRTLVIIASVVATLLLVGGIAYMFGTPQKPDATASAVVSGEASLAAAPLNADPNADPTSAPPTEPGGADMPAVPEGQEVPEPDPSTPLAIQIPGCKCHSDDPKVVKEHSAYRMNQCAGCHAGQTPTGN